MFSDMISYVKKCLLRRVRKLTLVGVHRFEYVYGKFGDTHGAMLKVMHRHVVVSQKCAHTRLLVREHAHEHVS